MPCPRCLNDFVATWMMLLGAGLACSCSTYQEKTAIPVYGYEVVRSYPHDRFAFTEGLAFKGGVLVEGTGLPGHSTLRKVDLETGEIIQSHQLAEKYFGEGATVFDNKIVQLTEEAGIGFVYDLDDLRLLGEFRYPTQGWGITWDGESLIMSDGSASLHFLDPETFEQVRSVEVRANGVPLTNLNELEYVRGHVYANIWPTDRIAMISPQSGSVVGWIDLKGLLSQHDQEMIGWSVIEGLKPSIPMKKEACLNGIAYDPENDRLFVTGKLWPKLFEIRLIGRSLSAHS